MKCIYKYNSELIKMDSELKYYLLGLIGSDGYISGKSNSIELQLKESDRKLLELLRDLIVPGKPVKHKQSTNSCILKFDSKEIHEEVAKYIVPGPKSLTFRFPTGIPDKYIAHFIRGYSDGDGNISVCKARRKLNSNHIKYYFGLRYRILGTKQFLSTLSDNLYRLGVTKNRVTPHRKENIYYIEYSFSSAKRVLDFIYKDSNFKLDRKEKVFQEISSMDSDTLGKNYNTPKGRYNTRDRVNNSEDIVDSSKKLDG